MKKVIFVGGTSFSGSTFFHMMLANDSRGFALGEIRYLVNPQRPHHVRRPCDCGDPSCKVWHDIKKYGEDHLYEAVFDQHPEVEFIVDSSKNIFWINKQINILQKAGIQTDNILIWKTPIEYANSCKKRNRLSGWGPRWMNYHRTYANIIQNWRSLSYSELTNDPTNLKSVCNYLDIPYFEGKSEFWSRKYHSFGGNPSARVHLSDGKDEKNEPLKKNQPDSKDDNYRKIYYSTIQDASLKNEVETFSARPEVSMLTELLENYDVLRTPNSQPPVLPTDLKMSNVKLNLLKLKDQARIRLGLYKYKRI